VKVSCRDGDLILNSVAPELLEHTDHIDGSQNSL
jgi:hypothetical protein